MTDILRLEQAVACLESCVQDYLGRNEELMAECCEDARREVQTVLAKLQVLQSATKLGILNV